MKAKTAQAVDTFVDFIASLDSYDPAEVQAIFEEVDRQIRSNPDLQISVERALALWTLSTLATP